MSCKILNEERWQKFLENRLSEDESAELLCHLKENNCPSCEQFFMSMDDEMRNILNAVFHDVAMRSSTFPTKTDIKKLVGPQEVSRQKKSLSNISLWNRFVNLSDRKWSYQMAWLSGVAVVVILGVGVYPQLQQVTVHTPIFDDSALIAKGATPQPAAFNLKFAAAARAMDGDFMASRGINGGQYDNSSLLFLGYSLTAEGYVYLVERMENGRLNLLFPEQHSQSQLLTKGEYNYPQDTAGISLAGLHGRYTIVGIYSRGPLDPQKEIYPLAQSVIASMFSSAAPGQHKQESSWGAVVTDVIYFDVRS